MMTRAYQEIYLSSVQAILGEAFDYAVNTCHIAGADFIRLFIVSEVCRGMEQGEPDYLAGKSGVETVRDILWETTGKLPEQEPQERMERSAEYWIGWAVAYYQWFSGRKYSEIFSALSYEDLEKMYFTLHEADVSKFADIADVRVREHFAGSNLKRIRETYGCTQAALAERSGVSLRSVQMYEQKRKDINKASAEALFSMSKVLGCTMEDLMEK